MPFSEGWEHGSHQYILELMETCTSLTNVLMEFKLRRIYLFNYASI